MDENDIFTYLSQAKGFLNKNRFDNAYNLLSEILEFDPTHEEAIFYYNKYAKEAGKTQYSPPPIAEPTYGNIQNIIEEIYSNKEKWSKVVDVLKTNATNARYALPKSPISKEINSYLEKKGFKFYLHQAKVFDEISAGKDIILSTPTASGKTISFVLPIFEKLLKEPDSRAIFIYPLKGLANDQLFTLNKILEESRLKFFIDKYDGDVAPGLKKINLQSCHIILTNPDSIHIHLNDDDFRSFLYSVKFIVIDEAHTYRGVFGTHVSYLIRRIRRLCKKNGNDPQFILSSATLGNPVEFAEKLVGKKFQLINESGAPSPEKYLVLYNPLKQLPYVNDIQTAANIFSFFIKDDIQTLCFSTSRKKSELVADETKKILEETMEFSKEYLDDLIIVYRGGLTPAQRKEAESKFRSRMALGCSATNALEVGIDIGTLDAVIVSGYPGSSLSFKQQLGRSGRSGQASIGMFIASEDVVDQLFMQNPEYLYNLKNEHALISTSNINIKFLHLCCAANESPLDIREDQIFFGDFVEELRSYSNSKDSLDFNSKIKYIGIGNPADAVNIRNMSQESFTVYHNNQVLETLDKYQASREGYENAIILHEGKKYLVKKYSKPNLRIDVIEQKNCTFHTQSKRDIQVKIIKLLKFFNINDIGINFGDLEIRESINKYFIISDHRIKDSGIVSGIDPLVFHTKGIWVTFPDHLIRKISLSNALKGLNGLINSILPIFTIKVMTDIRDIGSHCEIEHNDTGLSTIFFYDTVPGGVGFSDYAFSHFDEIIKPAVERIANCDCQHGCLGCVYSHQFNKKGINKEISLSLGNYIIEQISEIDNYSEHLNNNAVILHPIPVISSVSDKLREISIRTRCLNEFTNIPINRINYFNEIEAIILANSEYRDISSFLLANKNIIKSVQSIFDSSIQPYSEKEEQVAYVLLYYPFYIETIYRELTAISEYFEYAFSKPHINISIYCCGPAPEFIGLSLFFVERMKVISSCDVCFFEKNNWEDIRKMCITRLLPLVNENEEISIKYHSHTGFDFFSLQNPETYQKHPQIKNSQLHVFQNCIRDLLQVSGNYKEVVDTFIKFLDSLPSDSIVIIIDLTYENIKRVLFQIRESILNSNYIILRENFSPILEYYPNSKRSTVLYSFLYNNIYEKGWVRMKTMYCSLIILKINNGNLGKS